MQMSLNVKTPEMLVSGMLEELLKLKRVIGGSRHGILPWFAG